MRIEAAKVCICSAVTAADAGTAIDLWHSTALLSTSQTQVLWETTEVFWADMVEE